MFYIIASRIPLVYSDTTNRKFLKIFILGSLLYICIHYYLHLEVRTGIIDKIKSKLLFVMAGDFAVACALAKFLSPVVSTPTESEAEEAEDKPKYLANEKERIMKELEERRKAEMLRNQQAALVAQQQAQIAAQQQAQLAAQQQAQLAAQKASLQSAQVRVQEADRADKTKVKPKSRKKDTTSSSSTSTSTSTESEKPKKSDKKVEKKIKKDKHSSDEEDTEMPVYE
jgi:hypothetical protein